MQNYRLTKKAVSDLNQIYVYGAKQFGDHQADLYHADLATCFRTLAGQPRMGHEKTTPTQKLRVFFHRSHVIAYHVIGSDVAILRGLGNRQDWWQILEGN